MTRLFMELELINFLNPSQVLKDVVVSAARVIDMLADPAISLLIQERNIDLMCIKKQTSQGYDRIVYDLKKPFSCSAIFISTPGNHARMMREYIIQQSCSRESNNSQWYQQNFTQFTASELSECANSYKPNIILVQQRYRHLKKIPTDFKPDNLGVNARRLNETNEEFLTRTLMKTSTKETIMSNLQQFIIQSTTAAVILEQHPKPWTVKNDQVFDKFNREIDLGLIHSMNLLNSFKENFDMTPSVKEDVNKNKIVTLS